MLKELGEAQTPALTPSSISSREGMGQSSLPGIAEPPLRVLPIVSSPLRFAGPGGCSLCRLHAHQRLWNGELVRGDTAGQRAWGWGGMSEAALGSPDSAVLLRSCWLSLEGGLLYAFVGPAAVIVLVGAARLPYGNKPALSHPLPSLFLPIAPAAPPGLAQRSPAPTNDPCLPGAG